MPIVLRERQDLLIYVNFCLGELLQIVRNPS